MEPQIRGNLTSTFGSAPQNSQIIQSDSGVCFLHLVCCLLILRQLLIICLFDGGALIPFLRKNQLLLVDRAEPTNEQVHETTVHVGREQTN